MSKENYDYDFNTIYKSFINIVKLLQHQGFNIESQKDISLIELQNRIETNTINFKLEDESGNACYVIYHISKQLRPSHIQEYTEDIYQFREVIKNTDQLIIITKDNFNYSNTSGLSDTIENTINELYSDFKFYINIFPISILQFSILDHRLVPKHIKLTNEESLLFKEKYKILDESNIPSISKFDPVAKAIGLRPGEICKIIRPSKTVIESIYYRICI